MKKDELLALAISAHGGMEKWKAYNSLNAELAFGGATWALKGQEGILSDVTFQATLHEQTASFGEFITPDYKTSFRPGRVAIERKGGELMQELLIPRSTFAGHTIETPWNELQLLYFASYATWNYLTAPFNFTMAGFLSKEVEPWKKNGTTLRRLEVIFPDYIAAHSRKQIFYFTEEGLLRRFDYWPEVLGGAPAVQFVSDYEEFGGIMVPTKRRVYVLRDDGSYHP